MLEAFNNIINFWAKELEQFNLVQICTKPSVNGWSLGQLYTHLINDTQFYIEQIKICVSTNENENEGASPAAKAMFFNNSFPDTDLEGSPDNAYIPQPVNKEQLINELSNLKSEMNKVGIMISTTPFNGKTKHPALNYFNANEWFQFAEMHFRHHLRQKKKIGNFLRGNDSASDYSQHLFL